MLLESELKTHNHKAELKIPTDSFFIVLVKKGFQCRPIQSSFIGQLPTSHAFRKVFLMLL
jgi:hypothetical protein